ncbi:uncharacterized protein LOC128244807 isoform X2 [Mya arenaria]|uniref:uncharacterized protein LOC128244807 isoform X2 n=1 Tax=Mya arenaria TaxID=6604 RepID=UPI0022DEC8BE|nr:uncharacterized protein LOC128244807 isoform X2 [Mya arenaria]
MSYMFVLTLFVACVHVEGISEVFCPSCSHVECNETDVPTVDEGILLVQVHESITLYNSACVDNQLIPERCHEPPRVFVNRCQNATIDHIQPRLGWSLSEQGVKGLVRGCVPVPEAYLTDVGASRRLATRRNLSLWRGLASRASRKGIP